MNKLSDKALTNGWGNIDQRTIVISSGLDLVNIINLVITGSNDKSTKVMFLFIKKKKNIIFTNFEIIKSRNGLRPCKRLHLIINLKIYAP